MNTNVNEDERSERSKDTDASQMCGEEKQPQQRSGNEAVQWKAEQVDGDVVGKDHDE